MRIWLHSSAKSVAFSPSGVFSLVAHVALIGGAVYGTEQASRGVVEAIAERVHFLPPPDRIPDSRPAEHRVRYVAAGTGVTLDPAALPGAQPAGRDGIGAGGAEEQGNSETSELPRPLIVAPHDSVYSVLTVDEAATRVEGSAAPVYPPEMLENRVEGSVLARYEIDSTGHTDAASITIVEATNAAFARAVKEAIPSMRFMPAKVAGRRVRQVVQQSFAFHLVPDRPATAAEHTRATPTP